MMEVAIVGGGDLGREISYSILHNHQLQKISCYRFLYQDPNKSNPELEGITVYAFSIVKEFVKRNISFIIGIGHPTFSKKVSLQTIK